MAKADLQVIDSFIGLIDPEQLTNRALGKLGTTVKYVDELISKSVSRRYKLPANVKTASVIRGRSSSRPQKTGKYAAKHGIIYMYKSIPLSRFMADEYIGNIEPLPKRKPGLVHRVQVLQKGQPKISYGKHGYGGFIPRAGSIDGPKQRNKNFPKYGITMWERLSQRALPVVPLRGPSISQMVSNVLDHDTSLMDRISNLVLKRLIEL